MVTSERQGSLACCSPWGCKDLATEQQQQLTLLRWSNKCLFFFWFWVLLIEGLCFEENARDWRKRWATWGQSHLWHEAPSPLLSGQLSLNILIQKGKGVPGKGVSRPSYPTPPFCASKLESGSSFLPRLSLLISQGATLLLHDEEWSFNFG